MMKALKSLIYVLKNIHRVEGLLLEIQDGIQDSKSRVQSIEKLYLKDYPSLNEYREYEYGLEDVAI